MNVSALSKSLGAAWRIGFRHHLAYPSEVLIQLVAACLIAGLNAALWSNVADAGAPVAGIGAQALGAEVLVAWAGIGAIATRVHEDLGERFRDGQIAADLVRPVPLPALIYARDLGRACAAFGVQALPLLTVSAWLAPLGLTAGPGRWAGWAAALFIAHVVNVAVSFLLGLAAFRVGSVVGLGYLKATLVSLFAGALLPPDLLGPTLGAIARLLPFHLLGSTPARVLLGRGDLTALLLEGSAWAVGLWLFGIFMWSRVARTFTLQGG